MRVHHPQAINRSERLFFLIFSAFFIILSSVLLQTPTWEAHFHGWHKCSHWIHTKSGFYLPHPRKSRDVHEQSISSTRVKKEKKKSTFSIIMATKKKRRERNVFLMWYSCLWTLLKSRSNLTLKWALSTLLFHLLSFSSYCCLRIVLEQSSYVSFWGWSTWLCHQFTKKCTIYSDSNCWTCYLRNVIENLQWHLKLNWIFHLSLSLLIS